MKYSLIIFSFLLGFTGLSAASAANDIGEGYAATSFKELSQTILLMGGLDIKNPKVADEYARLVYCGLYQQTFKDDFEWGKIRSQIVARAQEKKEYYRVLYETSGVFKLDRYDTEDQSFPLSPDTAMVNVGSMELFTSAFYKPYCGLGDISTVFSPNINLTLNQPLTVNKIKLPQPEAEKLLARMAATDNKDRQIYGRVRFRITEAPANNAAALGRGQRVVLKGDITAVDFFLDSDLTKPVGK